MKNKQIKEQLKKTKISSKSEWNDLQFNLTEIELDLAVKKRRRVPLFLTSLPISIILIITCAVLLINNLDRPSAFNSTSVSTNESVSEPASEQINQTSSTTESPADSAQNNSQSPDDIGEGAQDLEDLISEFEVNESISEILILEINGSSIPLIANKEEKILLPPTELDITVKIQMSEYKFEVRAENGIVSLQGGIQPFQPIYFEESGTVVFKPSMSAALETPSILILDIFNDSNRINTGIFFHWADDYLVFMWRNR